MAFLETYANRQIIQGRGKVEVTLAGTVDAGDALGYSSGWVLSADAATIQPLLIAGEAGVSGQRIKAFMRATVKTACTAANVATVGDIVAITDAGLYAVSDAATMPEVGYVSSIGSDNLSVIVSLRPMAAQLTTKRS
jgi:hypothetical protein